MKNIIITTLLLLGLISCRTKTYNEEILSFDGKPAKPHTDPPPIQVNKTIYVDTKFVEEERSAIRSATERWAENSNGRIKYHLIFDYDVNIKDITNKIVIVYLNPTDDLAIKFSNNLDDIFVSAYVKDNNAELIFLCPLWAADEDQLSLIVQRELGKEMGLNYTNEAIPSVMNKDINDLLTCPTAYDMFQFCNLFLCSLTDVKHCKLKGQ